MKDLNNLIHAMAEHALEMTHYKKPLVLVARHRIKSKTILDSFDESMRDYFRCKTCLERIARHFTLFNFTDGRPVSIWRSLEIETKYRGFLDMLIEETERLAEQGCHYLTHDYLMAAERNIETQEVGIFDDNFWEGYIQLGRSEHGGYPHFYLMLTPCMLPDQTKLDAALHRHFGPIVKTIKIEKLKAERVDAICDSLGGRALPDVAMYSDVPIVALAKSIALRNDTRKKVTVASIQADFYSRLYVGVPDSNKSDIVENLLERRLNQALKNALAGSNVGLQLGRTLTDEIFKDVNEDEMKIYESYISGLKARECLDIMSQLELEDRTAYRNATMEDIKTPFWVEEETSPAMPDFDADTFRETMRKMKAERFFEEYLVQEAVYIEFVGFDHLGELRRFYGFSTLLTTDDCSDTELFRWHGDPKAENKNLFTTADNSLRQYFTDPIPITMLLEAPWRSLKAGGIDISYHYFLTDKAKLPYDIGYPLGFSFIYREELEPYASEVEKLVRCTEQGNPQLLSMPLTEHMAFRIKTADGDVHHVVIKDID